MGNEKNGPAGKEIHAHVLPELWDLVPGYTRHIKAEVRNMMLLAEKKDFDAIAKMAHNIKGSAGTYGMGALSGISQALFLAAKGNDAALTPKLLKEMEFYLENVKLSIAEEEE